MFESPFLFLSVSGNPYFLLQLLATLLLHALPNDPPLPLTSLPIPSNPTNEPRLCWICCHPYETSSLASRELLLPSVRPWRFARLTPPVLPCSIVINCADQPMVLLSSAQKQELSSPSIQEARRDGFGEFQSIDFSKPRPRSRSDLFALLLLFQAPSPGNDQSDVPVTWEAVCRGVVTNNASDSSEGEPTLGSGRDASFRSSKKLTFRSCEMGPT